MFRFSSWKRIKQGCLHNIMGKFFIFTPFTVQTSLVFRDGSLEVVRIGQLLHMQSIKIEKCSRLMYTSTFKKLECKVYFTWITRRTGAWSSSSSISRLPYAYSFFLQSLSIIHDASSNLIAIVSFATTTPDHFQFESQMSLSQINGTDPIVSNFKILEVFIEWGIGI